MSAKKKNNSTAATVLLIAVIILGFVVYQNRFGIKSVESGRVIMTFDSSQSHSFAAQRGRIITLSNDRLAASSQNGANVWEHIQNMMKPVMQIAGTMTLQFEAGGNDIALYDNGSKLWEYKTEQTIITAKTNNRGYTALVTYEMGYNSKITIINPKGDPIYIWQVSEVYVIDVDIASDCRYFAVAALLPDKQPLTTKISIADIHLEKIIGEVERSDSLVASIKYVSGNDLIAVGESELLCLSGGGQLKWAVDFGGRLLESFHINYNGSTALAFESTRNNSVVEIYGKKGVKTGEHTTDEKVTSLDMLNNRVCAASGNHVTFLSLSGRATAHIETERDIKQALLLSPKKAAVISGNSVAIVTP